MRQVGFGVLGCGVASRWHIQGMEESPIARLVAVCDEVEEKARALAEKHGVKYYTDYKEFLNDPDVEVVSICTPSSLHPEQAILAARAGKHVLTEKPMAITLKDAERMIEECHKQGVKLGVIFQRRVIEPFRTVKKVVEAGELGRMVLGDAYIKYYRSQEYYDSGGWRGTWKYDGGGCLMNQGIHIIDLLCWFMGPVDTIFGFAETLARKIEVEDTAVAAIKFENGALGVIEGATSVFPPTIPHRIELHGDKGSIMIEGEGVIKWDVEGPDGSVVSKLDQIPKGEVRPITSPTDISPEGHIKLVHDMAEAVLEDREPAIPGEEGIHALQVILGIYESARTGKPVKITK